MKSGAFDGSVRSPKVFWLGGSVWAGGPNVFHSASLAKHRHFTNYFAEMALYPVVGEIA